MNETEQPTAWEQAVAQLARATAYPPTPNLVQAVRRPAEPKQAPRRDRTRSWAVGVALLLAVVVLGAMAVPQTRAAVLTFIGRIGAIRFFVDETLPPAPSPVLNTPAAPATATPVPLALLAAVPGDPVPLPSLDEVVAFPVLLPPATSEWGAPDSAVVHEAVGHALLTLVWDDPQQPGRPVLTLSQTDMPQLAYKMIGDQQATAVRVHDLPGLWIAGPHQLLLPIDGSHVDGYLASSVLVWSDAQMTYRIEGDITLDEALRLAESLAPTNAP